jgi:ophiobolin F synthase
MIADTAMDTEEIDYLHLGQSWDLWWKSNGSWPTEREYINMVDNKTGGMFRLLARLMQAESNLIA